MMSFRGCWCYGSLSVVVVILGAFGCIARHSLCEKAGGGEVINEVDFVGGEMPGSRYYEHEFLIGPDVKFNAVIDVTTKGNGLLEVANLRLHVVDHHDDGQVFAPGLLHVEFIDVTFDGYRDLVIFGRVKNYDDQSDTVLSDEAVSYLYVFETRSRSFQLRYSHGPDLAY